MVAHVIFTCWRQYVELLILDIIQEQLHNFPNLLSDRTMTSIHASLSINMAILCETKSNFKPTVSLHLFSYVTWSISLLIGMALAEGGGQNGDNMVIWGVGLSWIGNEGSPVRIVSTLS